MTGPIAVITVAGLYRTGKSFILNQLAGGQAGFDIGGSVGACRSRAGRQPLDRTDVDVLGAAAGLHTDTRPQSRARRACGCGSSRRAN